MKLLCTASKVSWFTVVPVDDDGPYSAEELREEHEALLAAVVQMADEEGCRDSFNGYLAYFRRRYNWIPDDNKLAQRAFLLALAYFAEEKSQ